MTGLKPEYALERASQWAGQAGELIRTHFGPSQPFRTKADLSPVTDVDLLAQQIIVANITREFPEHQIIAEEEIASDHREHRARSSEYCWVVDPLDGTRNFAHGLPVFCVAIALLKEGRPIAGVIHDPNLGIAYTATQGGGAFADGRRLATSDRSWADAPLLGIPTPRRGPLPRAVREDWSGRAILRHLGSTCLNLAFTAAGALDASFGQEIKLWDIAAGALLVTEAGGIITTPGGEALFPVDPSKYKGEDLAFLAGGRGLHRELIESLRN